MDHTNASLGDLVRWYCRVPTPDTLHLGLVLSVNVSQRISNVLWLDDIITCDWEDLEAINESSTV